MGQIVNVNMPTRPGTFAVLGIEERAFQQHPGTVANEIEVEEPADRRISGLSQDRHLNPVFDFDALAFEGYELRAGLTVEFGLQLVPALDNRVAE